jgi:DNA-3-methyladenine glycosylase II
LMQKALAHFKETDPKMFGIASTLKLKKLPLRKDYFRELAEAILSQQLSIKASDTIILRMIALFPRKEFPAPEDIAKAKVSFLRKAGVSVQKSGYLKDLAKHAIQKRIDFKKIETQTDEEVIQELVAVKGIGRWTAEMFLIFSLGRPDVFSPGDLGLRNAIKKLYGMRKDPTAKQLERLSKKWAPYRSLASRYLWASLK